MCAYMCVRESVCQTVYVPESCAECMCVKTDDSVCVRVCLCVCVRVSLCECVQKNAHAPLHV